MSGKRLTQAELAKALGVTKGTVSKWKRAGLPIGADGRIGLAEAKKWRDARPARRGKRDGDALIPSDAKPRAGGSGPEPEPDGEDRPSSVDDERKALLQFRRARAMRETLLVQELRGDLVPLEEIDDLLVRRALEFRRGLERIENKIPGRFPEVAAKLKKTLHDEFRALLEQYSRTDPLLEGDSRRGKRRKQRRRT